MTECIFCKIAKKEIPSHIIYEDKEFMAFLDNSPVAEGHTLVIPKKHFPKLHQTDSKTLGELIQTAVKIVPAILKATQSTGYNIVINTEKEAGQIIFHTHIHIVPRKENDGLRFWNKHNTPKNDLEQTAKRIKSLIQ